MSGLVLLLLGLAGTARAQEVLPDGLLLDYLFSTRCAVAAAPGTPSITLVQEAQQTNAATYGALQFANDTLIPRVQAASDEEWDGEAIVFALRADNLFGVATVPAMTVPSDITSDCKASDWVAAPADLMTNRLGFARQWKNGGFFYAVSVNGYGLHTSQDTRFGAPYMLMAVNMAYAFGAPLLPAGTRVGQRFTLTWDWVGGARFTPGSLDLRAGYLGSQGFYSNIAEQRSSLFVGSAFTALPKDLSSASLPWVLAGLTRVPLPDELVEKIGRTRTFARRLRWVSPVSTAGVANAAAAEALRAAAPSLDVWTGHIEQVGLMEDHLDVRVVGGLAPTPFLHEASVGWRSDGLTPESEFEDDFGWGISAGVVTMPAAAFYGIQPGPKLALSATIGGEASGGGSLMGGLRLNQTELLDVHPYAVNAVSVFIDWSAAAAR
jgi:hypothetical protein